MLSRWYYISPGPWTNQLDNYVEHLRRELYSTINLKSLTSQRQRKCSSTKLPVLVWPNISLHHLCHVLKYKKIQLFGLLLMPTAESTRFRISLTPTPYTHAVFTSLQANRRMLRVFKISTGNGRDLNHKSVNILHVYLSIV